MRCVNHTSALAALVSIFGLICPGEAAAAFAAINCPPSPTHTTVPFTFVNGGLLSGTELPANPNSGTEYINYVDSTRYVLGNRYIKNVGFRVDSFVSEAGWDRLYYGDSANLQSLTGTPAAQWYDHSLATNLQRGNYRLRWFADYSSTHTGFALGEARVSCATTADSTAAWISPYVRYTALLLGSGDVVYAAITNTSAMAPLKHDSVALWGSGDAGSDFDLYIRCNAIPTETNYDYASRSSSNNEFIHLPETACTAGGTYYVAIHSYAGKGSANLVWTRHAGTEHRIARAGSTFGRPANANELDAMKSSSEKATRRLYGMTEGMRFLSEVRYYDNNGCSSCGGYACDICFHNTEGVPNSPLCAGTVNLYPYEWSGSLFAPADGRVFAHELAHRYICQDDEYCVGCGDRSQCGHSLLSRENPTLHNICVAMDHRQDPDPAQSTPTTQPYAWSRLESLDFYSPTVTPDNYPYDTFSFDADYGILGYIRQVGRFTVQ